MIVTIPLPWPPRILSPNSRAHWAAQVTPRKAYRRDANVLTRSLLGRRWPQATPEIRVTFCPPDNRGRDLDNCVASFKAAQDGIADALKINDATFRPTYGFGPVERGGRVIVTLTWGAE